MDYSNPLDRLLEIDWQFGAIAIFVAAGWIVSKRTSIGRSINRHNPRVVAGAELVFFPITVVLIGSLVLALLKQLEIAGFDDEVRFLTSACVYLVIAHRAARLIEVWIMSKSEDGLSTPLEFSKNLGLTIISQIGNLGRTIKKVEINVG